MVVPGFGYCSLYEAVVVVAVVVDFAVAVVVVVVGSCYEQGGLDFHLNCNCDGLNLDKS